MNHTVTLRDTTMTIDIYTFCTRIATTRKCGGYTVCAEYSSRRSLFASKQNPLSSLLFIR